MVSSTGGVSGFDGDLDQVAAKNREDVRKRGLVQRRIRGFVNHAAQLSTGLLAAERVPLRLQEVAE